MGDELTEDIILQCCLGEIREPRCGNYNVLTCRDSPRVRDHCRKCGNILSEGCQRVCPIGDARNRGNWCDAVFRDFCEKSVYAIGQEACSCFNSPLLNQGPPAPIPVCFDPVCSTNGYKTVDMQRQAEECNITYCDITIQCIEAGNCQIDDNIINTVCGAQGDVIIYNPLVFLGIFLLIVGIILIVFLIYYYISS